MVKFEIYVPLNLFRVGPKEVLDWQMQSIEDLAAANITLATDLDELYRLELSIEVKYGLSKKAHNALAEFDPVPTYWAREPKHQVVIIFRSEAKFPGSKKYYYTDPKGNKRKASREELEQGWRFETLGIAHKTVQNFIIAANIARPASLMPLDCVGFGGRRPYQLFPRMMHILPEALQRSLELGWPTPLEADISRTWDWYRSQPGPFYGISSTPVSRAVTAFTHTFDDKFSDKKIDNLIWNLAGLEALYTDGTPGVMHQLLEKSFVFLGKPENARFIRKKIKQMYNFRSRSVHGQSNTSGKYNADEDAEYEEKGFEERVLADELASMMLVCSLQKCAIQNRANLGFQYDLR